jgi:hypothetical protein
MARHCSFLAAKSVQAFREAGFRIATTGGTNGLPRVIAAWRREDQWRL